MAWGRDLVHLRRAQFVVGGGRSRIGVLRVARKEIGVPIDQRRVAGTGEIMQKRQRFFPMRAIGIDSGEAAHRLVARWMARKTGQENASQPQRFL